MSKLLKISRADQYLDDDVMLVRFYGFIFAGKYPWQWRVWQAVPPAPPILPRPVQGFSLLPCLPLLLSLRLWRVSQLSPTPLLSPITEVESSASGTQTRRQPPPLLLPKRLGLNLPSRPGLRTRDPEPRGASPPRGAPTGRTETATTHLPLLFRLLRGPPS